MLASCSGEAVVRFWDFEGGDNYSLGLGSGATPEEVVTCISYNSERGMDRSITVGHSLFDQLFNYLLGHSVLACKD